MAAKKLSMIFSDLTPSLSLIKERVFLLIDIFSIHPPLATLTKGELLRKNILKIELKFRSDSPLLNQGEGPGVRSKRKKKLGKAGNTNHWINLFINFWYNFWNSLSALKKNYYFSTQECELN